MVDVPAATPVMTPAEVIVATAVVELFHVPPETLLWNVVVLPTQTAVLPERLPAPPFAYALVGRKKDNETNMHSKYIVCFIHSIFK
jgi:hypothetical protein